MEEFLESSASKITSAIQGKVIREVRIDGTHMDDFFVIKFEDGAEFSLRYDYIYEWDISN